jgi:hypothetical protein
MPLRPIFRLNPDTLERVARANHTKKTGFD